ncbi:PITH domain-containing protein 1-like [Antedon mediterranea]|uniref:PITH domain-containing protein 1-like n=1 Tax=Antedon mediterranea TaxID=105859 RepID=UPI003AF5C984
MSGHSHGGGGGHGSCADEHSHDDGPERGMQFTLFTKIDKDNVECLNEVDDGSGKLVFKPWNERLNKEKFVESDADEELLFNIPFTGHVKLKGIVVIGGEEDYHPSQMRLFKNRPHMTFDDARAEPDQVFEMQRDSAGDLEYSTKIARFSGVHTLSIHFSKNFGEDSTKIYYIGLRGEFSPAPRQEVLLVSYEAFPNPADHKHSLQDQARHEIQ